MLQTYWRVNKVNIFLSKFSGYSHLLRVRNIVLLTISSALLTFSARFLSWALPITIHEVGGIGALGLIYTLIFVVGVFMPLISGWFSDVFSRKNIIIFGTTMLVFALTLFFLRVYHIVALAITLVLLRISPMIISTPLQVMVMESVPDRSRGKAFAIITSVALVAAALGSTVLGFAMVNRDFNFLGMIAIVLAVIALITRLMLKEENENNILRFSSSKETLGKICKRLLSVKLLVASASIRIYAIYGAIMTFVSATAGLYLPIYLKDVAKLEMTVLGPLYSTLYLLSGVIRPIAGVIVDNYTPSKTLLFITLIIGASLPVLAFNINAIVVMLAFLAIGIMEPFAQIADPVLAGQITEKKHRATIMGALDSISILVSIPAPLMGSLIWSYNPQSLMFFASILCFFSAPLMLKFLKGGKSGVNSRKTEI